MSIFKNTVSTIAIYVGLAIMPFGIEAKAPILDLSGQDISQVSEVDPNNLNQEYLTPPERFPSMTVALVDDIINARRELDATTNPNDAIGVPLPNSNEIVVGVTNPNNGRNEILTSQDGDEMFGRELTIIRRESQELAIDNRLLNQETLIASNDSNLLSQSRRPGYEDCVVRFYDSQRGTYRYRDECLVTLVVLNEVTQETYPRRFSLNTFCQYTMKAIEQDNLVRVRW